MSNSGRRSVNELEDAYSPSNPPPSSIPQLKKTRLYPLDVTMEVSANLIGGSRATWTPDSSIEPYQHIQLETKTIVSEKINIGILIYGSSQEVGGATDLLATVFFEVSNLSSAFFGVYNDFYLPCVMPDGSTPKRYEFGITSYGPNPNGIVSSLELSIDRIWRYDSTPGTAPSFRAASCLDNCTTPLVVPV